MAGKGNNSRDEIVRAIKRLRRQRQPLHYSAIRKSHGPLLRKAKAECGTWQAAVEAAGLDYENIRRIRRWSAEFVVEELTRLLDQHEFVTISELRDRYPKLYGACCRHYGTGLAALEAAGVDYEELLNERSERWTRSGVIDRIQQRYEQGHTLCRNAILRDEPHESRFCFAANYLFGNWGSALKAASLDPIAIRNRDGQWPRPKVLEAIRRRHKQGKLLNTDAMLRENLTLHAAGRRHFGTWEQAIKQAGLDYHQTVRGGLRGWTKPKVRRALKKRLASRQSSSKRVREETPTLYRAAVHFYGSWQEATKSVGNGS